MAYQFTEIGYYHPFCAPETEVVTITAWFDFPIGAMSSGRVEV